eukprot:7243926-Alexandrium_andersonii.AAC.1
MCIRDSFLRLFAQRLGGALPEGLLRPGPARPDLGAHGRDRLLGPRRDEEGEGREGRGSRRSPSRRGQPPWSSTR